MKVIEEHTVVVWAVGEHEGEARRKLCCDGWASDDYVMSATTESEEREATEEEIVAFQAGKAKEAATLEHLIERGVLVPVEPEKD